MEHYFAFEMDRRQWIGDRRQWRKDSGEKTVDTDARHRLITDFSYGHLSVHRFQDYCTLGKEKTTSQGFWRKEMLKKSYRQALDLAWTD